jgi:hypothetical protein
VDLVVGPGFDDAFLLGYPTNPNGLILESDCAYVLLGHLFVLAQLLIRHSGRQLGEIEFTNGLSIGGFRAMDFFGDGTFYLLDAPGVTFQLVSSHVSL